MSEFFSGRDFDEQDFYSEILDYANNELVADDYLDLFFNDLLRDAYLKDLPDSNKLELVRFTETEGEEIKYYPTSDIAKEYLYHIQKYTFKDGYNPKYFDAILTDCINESKLRLKDTSSDKIKYQLAKLAYSVAKLALFPFSKTFSRKEEEYQDLVNYEKIWSKFLKIEKNVLSFAKKTINDNGNDI